MKPFAFPLCDGRVRLRLLEKADLENVRAWRNRDDVRTRFFSAEPITAAQQLRWWEAYADVDGDWHYIIEALDPELGPRPAGAIALYHHDRAARSAEYGRLMIGEEWARGRGFARAASRLLLGYGFHQLGLQFVHLEVFANNVSAIGLYQSLGFEVQGRPSRPDALRMEMRRPLPASPVENDRGRLQPYWEGLQGWMTERPAQPAVSFLLVSEPGREGSVRAALSALSRQDCQDWEAVVVEDGASGVATEASGDPRVIPLHFPLRCGLRGVRLNQALLLARGRRVGLLSAPGLTSVGELAGMLHELEASGADLVVRPNGSMLARWRAFLTAGVFSAGSACPERELRLRASGLRPPGMGSAKGLAAPSGTPAPVEPRAPHLASVCVLAPCGSEP